MRRRRHSSQLELEPEAPGDPEQDVEPAAGAELDKALKENERLREAGDNVCRIACETYNSSMSWPDGGLAAFDAWGEARDLLAKKGTS